MNYNQQQGMMPQRNQFTYLNTNSSIGSTNNIVWVQGIEGAKAWQLSPNSMVILLDSEVEGKMYIKVSDNIGMSSLRIFNYTEEVPHNGASEKVTINNNDLDLSQFVRKDELHDLLKEMLNEQTVSTTDNTTKSESGSSGKPVKDAGAITIFKK